LASPESSPVSNDVPHEHEWTALGLWTRESRAHEAVDVVDFRATDVRCAEVVYDDLHAVLIDDEVVGTAGVIEGHAVLHPRAATAAHEDSQRELRVAFLDEKLLEARLGVGG